MAPITRLPAPPRAPQRIDTHAQAIDAARALAAHYRPGAVARDRERRLPFDEIERHTASGLGTLTVPRSHGGPDLPLTTVVEVFEIISAADASLGQIPQNQFGVIALLRDFGSQDQQARFFADILAGHRIGNAGPEKGKRALTHNETRLHRKDGKLVLVGERFYSTGAAFAHWIPTRAADTEGRPVQVWVRRDAPGVRVEDDWLSFGQRTTSSGTVVFDHVIVEQANILPVWRFAETPGLTGPTSQLVQAAIDSGIAAMALDDAASFVRDKARPWMDSGVERAVDDPTIIHAYGALQADFHAAQAVLYEAAETIDRIARDPVTAESSAAASVAVAEAKILTTDIALAASEMLFDLAGSSATRAAHGLDMHWRNARVHTLHDPVRWKYHLVGNYALNGVLPARHQWN
ncbi:SfnB family sulfur acquisition oxidoreductase [Aureimonas frigidaquae]|uniref:SfnB family sulfur acquisition oxidoreductase n=1 Tax=Aureimonas frigidaquae TaxID=424757 RepID=UPI000782AC5D|nr:SfnB family sulfur acquisition oxidoreductase [Aureimonas frigidaquae]